MTGFDIKKLNRNLNRFYQKLEKLSFPLKLAFAKQIGELFIEIVERTPKNIGRAKSGWKILDLENKEFFVKWRIVNSVPYIIALEFGWSLQAPFGMVRVSLDNFSKDIENQLKVL